MKYFDEINSHKYIDLIHIGEPEQNQLQMIIEEVKPSGPITSVELGDVKIENVQEIKATPDCALYSVVFGSYILYSVLNESFISPKDDEVCEGRKLCICIKSSFLNYLDRISFADSDFPGEFKHYRLNCSNHIVDIASVDEPIIEKKERKK
jgi:hypothetical protein